MIIFLGRYLIGILKCHQTGKKRYSRLAIICCTVPIAIVAPFQLRPEKKILLRPEKKGLVVCLAGARSLLLPEKKVLVVCLVGARSLL